MLNPVLYERLKRIPEFSKGVRVCNRGLQLTVKNAVSVDGKVRVEKVHGGEEYHVCCPICGDKRFRLYINHTYGTARAGIDTARLVKCYNENCEQNNVLGVKWNGNPIRFLEVKLSQTVHCQIFGGVEELPQIVEVKQELDDEGTFPPFPSPEWTIPLSQLPADNYVIQFIRDRRRFDPAVLEKRWGVVYAEKYPVKIQENDYKWLAGWLFIPTTAGWQARAPAVSPFLKYFSQPGWKKSQELYNLEHARSWPFVVLVEGVTDVWRVGGPAVALYGTSLSQTQMELVTGNFLNVVVLLDGDARTAKGANQLSPVQKVIMTLQDRVKSVFEVELPGDKDPADLDRGDIWNLIEATARRLGNKAVRRPDVAKLNVNERRGGNSSHD